MDPTAFHQRATAEMNVCAYCSKAFPPTDDKDEDTISWVGNEETCHLYHERCCHWKPLPGLQKWQNDLQRDQINSYRFHFLESPFVVTYSLIVDIFC